MHTYLWYALFVDSVDHILKLNIKVIKLFGVFALVWYFLKYFTIIRTRIPNNITEQKQ